MIQARKLKGFRDFDSFAARARDEITAALRSRAARAGFEEISTPALEYAEVLLGSAGGDTEKEVYRFEDHGGRGVALRFDLTVPFARYVAENQGTLIVPFKKFQVGEVFRGEKPQKGRYRQFCQADVDIIGADTEACDIEVIQLIARTINDLLGRPFTVHLGNRILLSALLRKVYGELSPEREAKVLIAIDKLEKIGADKVCEIIAKDTSLTMDKSRALLASLEARLDYASLAEQLPDERAEVERLARTEKTLARLLQGSEAAVKVDLSIARGLGYYTGIVFETTIDELPGFGSISSGGRYNELVSRFSKKDFPGVGGSIGVDRLVAALEELASDKPSERDGVFIAVADPSAFVAAFDLAVAIREAGKVCEVACKLGKVAQQFKYADRKNRAHVVVLGEDELASGTYTLKHLASGQEVRDVKGVRELLQQI